MEREETTTRANDLEEQAAEAQKAAAEAIKTTKAKTLEEQAAEAQKAAIAAIAAAAKIKAAVKSHRAEIRALLKQLPKHNEAITLASRLASRIRRGF